MHLCFKVLAATVWHSIWIKPFRPVRVLAMLAGVAAFVLFEIWLSICLALDYVFFPGFRRTAVKSPVFIIGNPRSGTSHLFRLMAVDEERFCSFTLLEILFPALTQRACFSVLRRIDPYLGRPFRRLRERLERRYLAPRDKLHRSRFNEPEEDDALSLHKFAWPVLGVAFVRAPALAALLKFDELPDPFRRSVMGFYKACVQRHLYWTGNGRALLSKNPTCTLKIHSLREAFPDARFVYIFRCPEVAIASISSMYAQSAIRHSGVTPEPDQVRKVYELMVEMYRYAFDNLERLPPGTYCLAEYEQLVSDPERLVHHIYDTAGLVRSPQFEQRLREATAESKRYRSRHQYSLESAGFTVDEVRAALPFIYQRYSFEESVV